MNTCAHCGSEDLIEAVDRDESTGYHAEVRRCRDCGGNAE